MANARGKVVAVRLSPESINNLIQTAWNNKFLDWYWQSLTHVCFVGWFRIVKSSPPRLEWSMCDFKEVYLPVLRRLFMNQPHLKGIWEMPSDLIGYTAQGTEALASSLNSMKHLCVECSIDFWHYIELDFRMLEVRDLDADFEEVYKELFVPVWLTVGGVKYQYLMERFIETIRPKIDKIILKTYGYLKDNCYNHTEYSSWRTITPGPESSYNEANSLLTYVTKILDFKPNQIVIGMSTSGVRFWPCMNTTDFDFITLKEIKQLTSLIPRSEMKREHNAAAGYSLLRTNDNLISYDNNKVRKMKLAMAKRNAGVIIGPLHNDEQPNSKTSLLHCAIDTLISKV